MAAIHIRSIVKQFAHQVVLDQVSLELPPGRMVGLVGANGSGKTTLLRIVTGQLVYDNGMVSLAKGLTLRYLPQEIPVTNQSTLYDKVSEAFAEVLAWERKLEQLAGQLADEAAPSAQLIRRYDVLSRQFEAAGGYAVGDGSNPCWPGWGLSAATTPCR